MTIEENRPIKRLAARGAVVSIMIFLFSSLVLRFMFKDQKIQLTDLFLERQKKTVLLASTHLDAELKQVVSVMKSGFPYSELKLMAESGDKTPLVDAVETLKSSGVVDIVATGLSEKPIAAGDIFYSLNMNSDELISFIQEHSSEWAGDVLISETIQIDTSGFETGFAIIIATRIPLPPEEGSDEGSHGMLAALLNVRQLDSIVQKSSSIDPGASVFVLDNKGFILSFSDPAFIGSQANEAFNLGRYGKLLDIVNRMKKGETGTGSYIAPDNKSGKSDSLWYISYTGLDSGGVSVAATFQQSDVPFLANLLWKYIILAAILFFAVAAGFLIFLRERARFFTLEKSLIRLSDASAVNEMLCNINSKLTEDKKKFETIAQQLEFGSSERTADIEEVARLFNKLAESIRRPSQNQSNMIKEIRTNLTGMVGKSDDTYSIFNLDNHELEENEKSGSRDTED